MEVRVDVRELPRAWFLMTQMGQEQPRILARAINHTGGKANTDSTRILARQMGLPYGKTRQSVKVYRATFKQLTFDVVGRGKAMSLRHFKPRQLRRGVSAAPWGRRRTFPGTFLARSRRGEEMGEVQVFRRVGKSRLPIRKLFGPSIPREMVSSAVVGAFDGRVRSDLVPRVEHEMAQVLQSGSWRRKVTH